jgi:hypothetical protein
MASRILAFLLLITLVPALAPGTAEAAPPVGVGAGTGVGKRFFAGGGMGLGFGDINYVDISPFFGVAVTERVSTGVSLLYRWREDRRYDPDVTTTDYGGSLFARIRIVEPLFGQVEYEYLSWEAVYTDLSTERRGYSSILGGIGLAQPLGGNATFYTAFLYNFAYDDDEISPYGSPWVIRAGVGFWF